MDINIDDIDRSKQLEIQDQSGNDRLDFGEPKISCFGMQALALRVLDIV